VPSLVPTPSWPGAHLSGMSLAPRLRAATRESHAGAEAALDLDSWLVSRGAYAALLLALRSFYSSSEARLRSVGGWEGLRPPIDLTARQRSHLLAEDLAGLDVDVSPHAPDSDDVAAGPWSLAAGLGCLYVLEGSRLGGTFIARRARAALGADLPVAFFSGGGQPPGAHWGALRRSLDGFGADSGAAACTETISGARSAFSQFVDCLSTPVAQ
jgi:heme oxygenase (biliverdin-IX-beta and delta-forming)